MLIGRDELCGLIPHGGEMCLLDEVVMWDEQSIHCRSRGHVDSDNPLRCDEGLSALHGIEYCAQAMAVHGGLLARADGATAPPGFLAALRKVEMQAQWLHDIDAPLEIKAHQLMADGGNFMYEFKLSAAGRPLLNGRATVMAQP